MNVNINSKIKNALWFIFAVVMVVVFVSWMIVNPRPEHIEDTNGANNYSLQTITERDVVKQKIGSRGAISESKTGALEYVIAGESANFEFIAPIEVDDEI